jgi:hypothetical protein
MRLNKKRSCKGGTNLVEIGPALFILIVVIMIPVIDMLALALAYASGYYLNHLVTRECAVHDPTASGNPNATTGQYAIPTAVTIAETTWKKSMLAGLAQATKAPSTEQVTYVDTKGTSYVNFFNCDGVGNVTPTVPPAPATNAVAAAGATPALNVVNCQVVTTLQITPIFVVPFFSSVPGLGAPVNFTYTGSRPQEEKGIK